MSWPLRIERHRDDRHREHFPGRFRLRHPKTGALHDIVAADEENLYSRITTALNGVTHDWWISWKTGEVRSLPSDTVVLVITHLGPARIRRTA